jgi:hypothetical protein
MLSDDLSQAAFEFRGNPIAAVNPDKAVTVEMDLRVSAGLVNSIHLESDRAQGGDGVAKRRAHHIPPFARSVAMTISVASSILATTRSDLRSARMTRKSWPSSQS